MALPRQKPAVNLTPELAQTLPTTLSGTLSSEFNLGKLQGVARQLGRQENILQDSGEKLDVDTLNSMYNVEGLTFDKPVSAKVAAGIVNDKVYENQLRRSLEQFEGGIGSIPLRFGAAMAGLLTDPGDLILSATPGIGAAKVSRSLATAGSGFISRGATRFAAGSVDGAIGASIGAGLISQAAEDTKLQYGLEEAFTDVAVSGLFGGVFSSATGGIGDIFAELAPSTRADLQRVALNRAYNGENMDEVLNLAAQDRIFAEAEAFRLREGGKQFENLDDAIEGIKEFKEARGRTESILSDIEALSARIGDPTDATTIDDVIRLSQLQSEVAEMQPLPDDAPLSPFQQKNLEELVARKQRELDNIIGQEPGTDTPTNPKTEDEYLAQTEDVTTDIEADIEPDISSDIKETSALAREADRRAKFIEDVIACKTV